MALGRGLGALIEEAAPQQPRAEVELRPTKSDLVSEIEVEKIQTNPFQPRTTFDEEALQELASSIRELGIIQPLTVRRIDGGYQLISGERRLRAAKIAGLNSVPAYIRTANDQGMLEMALVENIQREDLDAIEVAINFQRLLDECSLTHEVLSERVGKKRTTITNYLRLLKLPAEVQLSIRERNLSMGHAKAILSIEDSSEQIKLSRRIIKNDLSVRQTESIARNLQNTPVDTIPETSEPTLEVPDEQNLDHVRRKLNEVFGWGVEVKPSQKGKGRIVISYRSHGELEEILEKLNRLSV